MEEYSCPEALVTALEEVDRSSAVCLVEQVASFHDGNWELLLEQSQSLLKTVWERLHTGPWKEVNPVWREVYSHASLLNAFAHLARGDTNAALGALDRGLLMGCPVLLDLPQRLAGALEQELMDAAPRTVDANPLSELPMNTPEPVIAPERAVPRVPLMPLETFRRDYLEKNRPVIITGGMAHWPAMSTRPWRNLAYLKSVAGPRVVPVEVGGQYTDDDWTQELVTFSDYIDACVAISAAAAAAGDSDPPRAAPADSDPDGMAPPSEPPGGCTLGQHPSPPAATSPAVATSVPSALEGEGEDFYGDVIAGAAGDAGHVRKRRRVVGPEAQPVRAAAGAPRRMKYLAQHRLFDQVPALRRDISVPDYCCLERITFPEGVQLNILEPDVLKINAWLGPAGTVSPCHWDSYDNIFAQVVGRKHFRLFSHTESEKLYPRAGALKNTSQVDVDHPDLERFPEFATAKGWECVLQPGELLFIPVGCWHYVRALDVSFSVSFWWP